MPHGLTPTGRANSSALRCTAQYGRQSATLTSRNVIKEHRGSCRRIAEHR